MATQTKTMTTQEVADRFHELSQEGKFDVIVAELFDENAESIEPADSGWENAKGLAAIAEKSKKWQDVVQEMHGGYTNKPEVAGRYFVCTMGMDVTMKGQSRMMLDEVAVYKVVEGKIVSEQFFF